MANLMITVLALVLIAAMILVGQQYLDGSMTKGKDETTVARSLNEVNQIKGAMEVYKARTGTAPSSLDDLVGTELSAIPDGWGQQSLPSLTAFVSTQIGGASEEASKSICVSINKRLGLDLPDPPACDTIDPGFTGCCEQPDA